MVNRHKEAEMPMDCAWIDIDYMDDYKPFTYSQSRFPPEKFSEFVKILHKNHQKLVVIVDPGIKVKKGFRPYDEGIKKNLFIKRADGKDFVGKVWPGTTVFPDWFHPDAQQYWTEMIKQWLGQVPIDGLWIGNKYFEMIFSYLRLFIYIIISLMCYWPNIIHYRYE